MSWAKDFWSMFNGPVNKWLKCLVYLPLVNLTELCYIDQNEKRCYSPNFKFNLRFMLQILCFH